MPGNSSRELDALFDQAPVALAVLDPELRTRRTNAELRRLFGLPDEAVIGRRPASSLNELCDSVLASLGAGARDDIALLLARPTTKTAR